MRAAVADDEIHGSGTDIDDSCPHKHLSMKI